MAEVHNFTCPSGFEPEKVKQDDQSQISANLDEEDDENIELWMIKAPLNFDISLLSGRELEEQFNIPLAEKSDIEFVGKATADHPTCKAFQTVFPHKTKNKLKIGPSFKGYVDIVQSVKIHSSDHVNFPQEKPCEIPFNLKQRYIPYGSNSPAKISSTSKIKEKSKKRKRNSESLSFSIPDLDASQVSQAELENPPLKKRKKHKEKEFSGFSPKSVNIMDSSCLMPQTPVPFSMADLDTSQSNPIDLEESSLKKKKHKEKKELNKSVTSVDMKDDNGSSLPQTPTSISMADLDASQSNPIDLNESSSRKKKKKHKEKKEFSETPLFVDMMEDSCLMPQTPVPFSMADLDASQSNPIDLEESSLKKKKHKEKKELNKSVTSVDMKDDNGSSLPQTPTSISMADLDASQSNPIDLNESSSRKKKKKHKEKKEFSETPLSVDMMEDSCLMPQTPENNTTSVPWISSSEGFNLPALYQVTTKLKRAGRLAYELLVGGVLNMKTEHFQLANGYSNMYWGWGGEDDDMAYRILYKRLKILRPPSAVARYKMVRHKKRKPASWKKRSRLLQTGRKRLKYDGLNSVQYRLVFTHYDPLFTHFMVDIGPAPPR